MLFPGETAARLEELVDRYALGPAAGESLRGLLEIVAADDVAPTTVRDPAQAVDVHIADSLVGIEVEAVRGAGTIADLGAGAGFPGLVLASALPASRVSLVESVGRKCSFMERAVEAAGLTNASVVCGRVEEWHDGLGSCDVVTARALAPLAAICEYAAPLLTVGGTLVAWKGARQPDEEASSARAAAELGLELAEIRRVEPWPGVEQRHLYLYSKVMETPSRFPRRPGMARKRPLGGST